MTTDTGTVSEAGWRIAGAAVRGTRHLAANEGCQDRFAVRVIDGALIAVVADGAGSSVHGGDGAELLCAAVIRELAERCTNTVGSSAARRLAGGRAAVRAAVAAARDEAEAEAARRGCDVGAFNATLVGAVVPADGTGLLFHIGDGAGLAFDAGGGWVLSPPANGEYAETTWFFTAPDWRRRLRVTALGPDVRTVLLMTDGVTDIGLSRLTGTLAPHRPFFDPICRYLAASDSSERSETALAAMLDSPAVCERTSDDKTLVWAHRG